MSPIRAAVPIISKAAVPTVRIDRRPRIIELPLRDCGCSVMPPIENVKRPCASSRRRSDRPNQGNGRATHRTRPCCVEKEQDPGRGAGTFRSITPAWLAQGVGRHACRTWGINAHAAGVLSVLAVDRDACVSIAVAEPAGARVLKEPTAAAALVDLCQEADEVPAVVASGVVVGAKSRVTPEHAASGTLLGPCL